MSTLEDTLERQISYLGLPHAEREWRFAPPRRWRADFCWPEEGLIVEAQGGIWVGGRHTRGGRAFLNECERLNAMTLAGFRVLWYCREHIESGTAITQIQEALKVKKGDGR